MSETKWYIGIGVCLVVLVTVVLLVVLPKKSGSGNQPSGNQPSGNQPSGNQPSGNMPSGCANCFMADADCAPVFNATQNVYMNSPNASSIQCAKYYVENGDPRNPSNPDLQSTLVNSNLAGACDNLMVAVDGNCGTCYQQVYNAHLDKCTQAGDIRSSKPNMTCATLMGNMDCGTIDSYLTTLLPANPNMDPNYAIHKQVQDCYFQAVQSYKESLSKECVNNCQQANSHIQECVKDCKENSYNQDCTRDCQQEDSHYFPFKPCGTACSDACKIVNPNS